MKIRKIFVVIILIIYLLVASFSIFGGVLNTVDGNTLVLKTTPTFQKYWDANEPNPKYLFNPPGDWYFNNNFIEVSHSTTFVRLFFWVFEIWRFSTLIIVITILVYSLIKFIKFFKTKFL